MSRESLENIYYSFVSGCLLGRWTILKLACRRDNFLKINMNPDSIIAGMSKAFSTFNKDELLKQSNTLLDKMDKEEEKNEILYNESLKYINNSRFLANDDIKYGLPELKNDYEYYLSLLQLNMSSISKINLKEYLGIKDGIQNLISTNYTNSKEFINEIEKYATQYAIIPCNYYINSLIIHTLNKKSEFQYNLKPKDIVIDFQGLRQEPEFIIKLAEDYVKRAEKEIENTRSSFDYNRFIEKSFLAWIYYLVAFKLYELCESFATNSNLKKDIKSEVYSLNEKAIECMLVLRTYGTCSFDSLSERLTLIEYPKTDVKNFLIEKLEYIYNSTGVVYTLHYEVCKNLFEQTTNIDEFINILVEKKQTERLNWFKIILMKKISWFIEQCHLKYEKQMHEISYEIFIADYEKGIM